MVKTSSQIDLCSLVLSLGEQGYWAFAHIVGMGWVLL